MLILKAILIIFNEINPNKEKYTNIRNRITKILTVFDFWEEFDSYIKKYKEEYDEKECKFFNYKNHFLRYKNFSFLDNDKHSFIKVMLLHEYPAEIEINRKEISKFKINFDFFVKK